MSTTPSRAGTLLHILRSVQSRRQFFSTTVLAAATTGLSRCHPGRRPTATPASDILPGPDPETCRILESGHVFAADEWTVDFACRPDGDVDRTLWNVAAGGLIPSYNDEAAAYRDSLENVRIDDGVLVLEARKSPAYGFDYSSGRVDTQGKFSFTHGRLEITARIPDGVGTWPAFWLLPESERYDLDSLGIAADDPYAWTVNGEIDVLEAIGSIPNTVMPAVHTYENRSEHSRQYATEVADAALGFHTYGVSKTPDRISFELDGRTYAAVDRPADSSSPLIWPFEQPYYLILNLAMGGEWGGVDRDVHPPRGIDDRGRDSWRYEIRSVRFSRL